MIFTVILRTVVDIINAIFSFLPPANTFPIVLGTDLDYWFWWTMSIYKNFAALNWPFVMPMACFVLYFGFELLLMAAKFILGSRAPGETTNR